VWQAATNGLYEKQDDNQPDYNLRGRFTTDEDGRYEFVALMPTAYPVPTDGPVGELLRVAKRWSYRSARRAGPRRRHFRLCSAPGAAPPRKATRERLHLGESVRLSGLPLTAPHRISFGFWAVR
jgi:protocatechuate 3,4-dioxygenase beta subunit